MLAYCGVFCKVPTDHQERKGVDFPPFLGIRPLLVYSKVRYVKKKISGKRELLGCVKYL